MHPIQDEDPKQEPSLLDRAMEYHRRGWSIIPIKPGTEKPACRSWKPFQDERPDTGIRTFDETARIHRLAVSKSCRFRFRKPWAL